MPASQLLIYLLVYMLPTLFLFGLGGIVIVQNPKRLKNRLVAVLVILFGLLFFFEFIRHLLPLSMSAFVINIFVGNTGLLIISVMFHLYIYLTKLHERIQIPFYPYICYIPFSLIILSMLLNENYINNSVYVQQGIWYVPVFNTQYYVTMTISNLLILLLAVILFRELKRTTKLTKRKLLRFLIVGTVLVFFINVVLGYFNYGKYVPPHSHILLGLVFSFFLTISVVRFQLLPSVVKRYQVMFDLSPVSISVVNSEWDILELNENAKKEMRLFNREGANLLDFAVAESNKQQLIVLKENLEKESILHDYPVTFEINGVKDSAYYSVDASLVMIDEEEILYMIWRNVTEELKNEHLVHHMAYHDGLTELHNRTYFVSAVKERMITLAERPNFAAALVLIDLNRFKEINDTYGHAVGDEVLQHTAFILKDSIRKNDTVARLGGDEFIVFLEDFPTQVAVINWIDRLRAYFRTHPFVNDTLSIGIEPSIGLAFYPLDGDNFEEIFQYADMKMYEDKMRSKEESSR